MGTTVVTSQAELLAWSRAGTLVFGADFTLSPPFTNFPLPSAVAGVVVRGDGHTITIDATTEPWPGLFNLTDADTVSNFTLNFVTGSTLVNDTGALGTGSYATIETIAVTGEPVLGTSGGGVLGSYSTVTTMQNCYSTAVASADMSSGVLGPNCTGTVIACLSVGNLFDDSGGIAGLNFSGQIRQCYTTGNISNSGGICSGGALIRSCYSTGSVSSGASSGGILNNGGSQTIENCYGYGGLTVDSAAIGLYTSVSVGVVDHCFGLNAVGLGPGSRCLTAGVGGPTPTHSGFGDETWPPTSELITGDPDTSILMNDWAGDTNIWCDINGVSPPVADGPFMLTVFYNAPWNHRSFSETGGFLAPPPLCFGADTRLLCRFLRSYWHEQHMRQSNGQITDTDARGEGNGNDGDAYVEEYLPINRVKVGTLVKTGASGWKRVVAIGSRVFKNTLPTRAHGTGSVSSTAPVAVALKDRPEHALYVLKPSAYVGTTLFAPLTLTGAHSVLVPKLTDDQRAATKRLCGDVFVTEGRWYRLCACLDSRAEWDVETPSATVWHLALEHDNPRFNYGVWANGLLVETASIRMMRDRMQAEGKNA